MSNKLKPRQRKERGRRSLQRLVMLDDDNQAVKAGDCVRFSYGIPPVGVTASVVQRGRQLIALTPGHNPTECNLRSLRKYVGGWLKHNAQALRRGDRKE